ncbi:MAG: MarR family transcriptional regulator [candidate division KSB1 bacterium]|nr:MarR family transcriptional regulator [candidate division KSB1 bacterium]
MESKFDEMLERFSNAFIPMMHFFHNLASEASRGADFSLAQYRVLMLVKHRGAMSIHDLQQQLHIAQSTASEMVERLVQQNLLLREKDPNDRRITVFKLSKRAEKILERRRDVMNDCYRKVLEPLTEDEQIELVEALETILKIIHRPVKN